MAHNWKRIALEYFNARGSMGGFFRTLCEAIQRADLENLARLRRAYLELVKEIKGE